MDFETGDDVGRIDLSTLECLEDRIGGGVAIYTLDAVVGLSMTKRFSSPRDFLRADARLGLGAGGDIVHVSSMLCNHNTIQAKLHGLRSAAKTASAGFSKLSRTAPPANCAPDDGQVGKGKAR
jgi:hypothetical protein